MEHQWLVNTIRLNRNQLINFLFQLHKADIEQECISPTGESFHITTTETYASTLKELFPDVMIVNIF